jgi:zinc finger SWIM domain-containing protein 3
MEFITIYETYNFYNAYADLIGFSVRKDSCTKSTIGVSSYRFVCSKKGFSKSCIAKLKSMGSSIDEKTPEREHESTRTGCKAYLRVRLLKTGVWQVSIFQEEHNHVIVLSPSKNRNLHSHKQLHAEDIEAILDLSAPSKHY